MAGTTGAPKGLQDVVANESSICFIDGAAGVLSYRGIDIHELAQKSSFEEITYLLWNGALPTAAELNDFSHQLAAARHIPDDVITFLQSVPKTASPMEVLRTTVSLLGIYDPDEKSNAHTANIRKSFRLTAKIAMIVAMFDRIRKGKPLIKPDTSLSHAGNFLWMLNGEKPSETATKALDVALVLHADHELNASTFAARVIAATLSDMHSAITGAIGALKGPLHGGANEAVMHLLYEIDKAGEDPVEHVRKMLAEKQKISGFGHRVYTTEDPRATHLRRMSEDLGKDANPKWYEMSRAIELFVKEEKKLNANVDFYSASTYTTLGIDIDLFTPIFAISRIAGWCAHVIEQHDDNRLIRPRADYTGPKWPAPYTPIEQRTSSAHALETKPSA
ncbi:citrate synthase [Bryocella elongata]|uniref:Citrate synthase n=1 Tax=Bryocella elongata TaxID=863522 RepID=A0A1H5ZGS9_9BACT|nr:citrate synthase [Bryocella elongata]SEG35669.1 citrate synthase [Bryocella elongata]